MRPVPVIQGARVRLRPLQPSDREARVALGRDPEFVRLNGGSTSDLKPFGEAEADRWLRAFPNALRWAIEHEGEFTGEVRLDDVDTNGGRARFAIGIYGPSLRNRGLGTEATTLVLDYAFRGLQLEEVRLRVLAFNARAIRCYRKCGFRQYALDERSALIDGTWYDDLLMVADPASHRATLSAP